MPKTVNVRVTSMDSELDFSIPKSTTGGQLYEQVARTIGLQETWYFGLQFVDNEGFLKWIKDRKRVTDHKVKKEVPLQFKLRVKFYPENAEELIQDLTRKLFFLHVKDLILSDHNCCPPDTAALLASYADQDKFRHYDRDSFIHLFHFYFILFRFILFYFIYLFFNLFYSPNKCIKHHQTTPDVWFFFLMSS
uniref:FERM domain-containing protein n=1 Tax=Amphiprion percula TaxID=161767 RepID=A0A3P8RW28_AMPPE